MQVTATLLPVARDIQAKAGDKVICVAGVIVGVYTGSVARAAIANDSGKVVDSEAPKPRKSRKVKQPNKDTILGLVSAIKTELRNNPRGLHLRNITVHGAQKHQISYQLDKLVKEGIVVREGSGNNTVYKMASRDEPVPK